MGAAKPAAGTGVPAVLWRGLRAVLLGLVAIVIFIEEWGWRPLSALAARLARLPVLARLETRIRRAPPRVALALFLLPAVLLFPVKLAALWLIDGGRATLGVAVIVAAKLLGTAFVGRVFVLVEPQLMQFAWFGRALGWWHAVKARIVAAARASPVWRAARAMRGAARRLIRAWRGRFDR